MQMIPEDDTVQASMPKSSYGAEAAQSRRQKVPENTDGNRQKLYRPQTEIYLKDQNGKKLALLK
jgi:hypothetical protein